MKISGWLYFILILLSLCFGGLFRPLRANAAHQPLLEDGIPRSIFAYGAKWADSTYGNITLSGQTNLQRSYLWTVGFSHEFYRINRHLSLENEMNITRHSGEQDHLEANFAASFRWWTFPWDNWVETTLAHGIGPSFAAEHPPVEENDDDTADRFLLFMQTEFTFAPPVDSRWEFLVRIHHRSGVFGLISEDSGSNFLAGGFRYRF